MSKLGYFLGGVLAGVIGTAIAAYAVDACPSSSSDVDDEQSGDMAEPLENEMASAEDEVLSEPAAEPSPA